jgi:hypothetical protein
MVFKNTDIEHQLDVQRNKQKSEDKILEEVRFILSDNFEQEAQPNHVPKTKNTSDSNDFDFDLLETNRIYHIDQIKKICIDYRLRFLDRKYFKGKVPEKAASKIRDLETIHNIEIRGFKIMAPSKLFKLEDKDDPLLFAPIGNDYFYLIDKWGNDLHPLRKLLVWPFKNIVNLTFFVFLISYLVALMVPNNLFSKNDSLGEFFIIFFFMFKCIASVVIFYGFALGKNFNPAIWNSRYFNA